MIVLGLTGSIGMGKSRAASMMRLIKIPVHDSDRAVHKALSPKGEAFEAVAVMFPESWDKKARLIDRKKLGEIVFSDEAALKKLENILHPIVQKSQSDFLKICARAGKKIAVLEIPLLFETGAEKRVDYVVCVSAPENIQRRRVLARKGMTTDKFTKILARQMPDGEKRARSDFVINTGMGHARTFLDIKKMIKKIGT